MKPDPIRIKSYLAEIRRNSLALNQLIDQDELAPDSIPLGEIKTGRNDFDNFIEEIEAYMGKI